MDDQQYTPITNLLQMLMRTGKNYDLGKIRSAYDFAAELHKGQFRQSGEEYIYHPIAVAEIVASLELDTDSICAALLHDTVEDCEGKVDIELIKKKFGSEVASLVDGLTKLVTVPFEDKEEQQIENLRKMFLAMSKDIRVIFIKLCDRLHNMRTLDAKTEYKRRLTAHETMHVYAPLAHRLGMQRIRQELEMLSLSYLDPIGFNEVKKDIESRYGKNRDFLEKARLSIAEKLTESGIKFSLEGRVKTVYSIYRKIYFQNKSFDEIYDFYALRIIVDTEPECYFVLGAIHDMFKFMPGRFKDYISTPKANNYRSLHTTVIGRDGIPFEVQIRTWEMHQIAEYGIAAHWKYKSGEKSKDEVDKKLEWISRLVENESETRDPDEFINALKVDIFQDEVFVFTPKSDVIPLPAGSTVIDFAYAIHSQIGNRMVGAKINGNIVPIDRVVKNGEIVEILTSQSSKGPSRDWLKIVKTGEARTKIRQWFKKEARADNIVIGKGEIDKIFRRFNYILTEPQRADILSKAAKRLGINGPLDDLYNAVGYGGLSATRLIPKIRDEYEKFIKVEAEQTTLIPQFPVKSKPQKSLSGIIVEGIEGGGSIEVKLARCCNPIPGDPIVGFITKGHGLSVHNINCSNLKQNRQSPDAAERFVSVSWDDSMKPDWYTVMLQITARQSTTLLLNITALLAEMKVAVSGINMPKTNDGNVRIDISISVRDVANAANIANRIKMISGVYEVTRTMSGRRNEGSNPAG
ncbi:MAG TPA: bifunctional (p)ppGpp synthetase/guanosine-3',5'-bis(diphosphate) 3'-pyrophosphohydrolase [Clostridiales bacterium]|jgi:GTP pyrophosphokinase|nr:bifunctional (p)ppGpp synthetase/guanosine-3',5'-bis(diphosphate) 3'-pyrophosphohydrolase [Clostridiales bacterium]